MARPHGLSDEEYDVIRALQEAAPTPPVGHPIWEYLESSGLVWIDRYTQPNAVRLTPVGRGYPHD